MEEEKGSHRRGSSTARVSVLELPCPSCGEKLRHRVLHVKGGSPGAEGGGAPGRLEGIARCARCHTAHPFLLEAKQLRAVPVIVSEGPESFREEVPLPEDRTLELDGTLRVSGRPVRITRIEGPMARNLHRARPSQVVAVWTVPTDELTLRVSLVEGARTRSFHLTVKGDQELRVGDQFRVEGETVEITGLRARGRTYRELGDVLPAREVQRIYGRSTRTPPGGRSAWRRSREMPRS